MTNNRKFSLSRVFNTPLLVHSDKLQEITSFLLRGESTALSDFDVGLLAESRLFTQVNKNLAVIEIDGTLVSRRTPGASGMVSYPDIEIACQQAIDAGVSDVVIKIHTSGGEVDNLARAKKAVDAMASKLSVVAVVDRYALSAGYWLISGVDKIYLADKDARVGSIGVRWEHLDFSGYMEKEGIKVTTLFKGDHKNDFTPYEPLSDNLIKKIESELETIYDEFVDVVSDGRGMKKADVVATQADVFGGESAIECGLADEIKDVRTIIGEFMEKEVDNEKVVQGLLATDEGRDAIVASGFVPEEVVEQQKEESFKAVVEETRKTLAEDVGKAMSLCIVSGLSVDQAKPLIEGIISGDFKVDDLGVKIAAIKAENSNDAGIDGNSPADEGMSPADKHLAKYENKTIGEV